MACRPYDNPAPLTACRHAALVALALVPALGGSAEPVALIDDDVPRAAPAALTWTAPTAVAPGGIARVYVAETEPPLDAVMVALVDPSGRQPTRQIQAFRTDGHDGDGGRWVALVGIPTTVAPSEYGLVIDATRDPGRLQISATLLVTERAFASFEIALSASLSELRRSPDPRKDEQSRRLNEILFRFDPTAEFHSEALRLPLVQLRRTSVYGDRRRYLYHDGSTALSVHRGVDYAAVEGTPVHAAGAGRIAMARPRIVTGNTVVLEHLPGVFSLYYHLHALDVNEGQLVAAGARLGSVGSTGLATGAHLHWEVRVGGVAVDPLLLMDEPLVDR